MVFELRALQILLAAGVGGTWVGGTTFAAKRLGSGTAGVIGGLPAISGISYIFIALNQSAVNASRAAYAFPIGLSITMVYLLVFASLAKYGFRVAFASAIGAWLTLAAVEDTVNIALLVSPTLVVLPIFVIGWYTLKVHLKLPYTVGVPVRPSRKDFLSRAILGGIVVGAAVSLSLLGGPLLGGVAAAFPGIFSTTIYSTYQSERVKEEGLRISRALTKPLMLSAMIVAYPYSLLIVSTYQSVGLILGTMASLSGALVLALLAYLMIKYRVL